MNQGFGLSAPDSSALDPSARPSSCRAGSSAVISLTRLLAPRPCVMPHCGFEENFLVGSRARFGRCCSCGAALSASAHVREGRVGGCRGRAASARPAPSSPPPPRTTSPGFLPTPPARCCCRCRCASGGWPQPRQVLTPLSMRELPCWAQSPCDNRRFQGSPSIPQLALVMPTGSQRRAASARLNERKCRAPATTISAMTSCRPRCVEVLCSRSGSATTACRRMADKRQIQRVGGPLSRSKSGGRVMQ